MRNHSTASTVPHSNLSPARNGILVLSGYGVRLGVDRGHLVFSHGLFGQRHEGRLSRATAKLRRVVMLGHSGTVTLDALRWIADVGAAFVQIDADGRVVICSAPAGLDDPRLRRAQALAVGNRSGLSIVHQLIREKMKGQAQVAERLPDGDGARADILKALDSLERAHTAERIRIIEAAAANAYWSAWSLVAVRFARRDQARVPDHWMTFGSRTSPLTQSPRTAANPANAILNYLYAVLETETRVAVLTMGMDPGVGLLHADQRARDSLVLDLMESVRPEVDAYVLDLIRERTFAAREFAETSTGNCRLVPPLPQLLAETAHHCRVVVLPIVERVAQSLMQSYAGGVCERLQIGGLRSKEREAPRANERLLPTPLTQDNRSAGRDGIRRRPKRARPQAVRGHLPTCLSCGGSVSNRSYRYCESCRPERLAEIVATFAPSGPRSLTLLRAEGRDPAHGGEAARKRGGRNARHQLEAARWNAVHPRESDPDTFRREILPGLRPVPLSVMTRETGLSRRYCWMIRNGSYAPHPRHWDRLRNLTDPNGG